MKRPSIYLSLLLVFIGSVVFGLQVNHAHAIGFTTGQAAVVALGQTSLSPGSVTSGNSSTTEYNPYGDVFDSSGNLWVMDTFNSRVLEYPKANLVTGGAATVALGQTSLTSNGTGDSSATLHFPFSGAFDSSGNLWVVDTGNNRVLEYPKANLVTGGAATVALGQTSLTSNGTGDSSATLNFPEGISFDSSGNLWVVDNTNNRVLEYPKANLVTGGAATVALGQTSLTSNGTDDASTTLARPSGLAFDSSGNLWVTDAANYRVLEYPKANLVTGGAATVALGQTSLTSKVTGDSSTTLSSSQGDLTFDSSGNLWVVDTGNNRVLEYPKANLVTGGAATVALGQTSLTSNGSGDTSTTLSTAAQGLTFDSSGNLWVMDKGNNRVLGYALPVYITPLSLPNATTSVAYSQVLTAMGGSAPYTWSIISGTLPSGFTLATSSINSTTTISGIPTSFGISNFTVQVVGGGTTISQNYTLQVGGGVALIAPTSNATVSSTITLSASSTDSLGIAGIRFQLDGANLGSEVTATSSPNTYSYSWNTASNTNGSHAITAIAYDTANNTSTASVNITVANAPVISNVIATTTATIFWTTDEPATSQVQYGLTSAYGSSSILNSTPTTTHSVSLSGLTPNTTYHFMVQSSDDGFFSTSSDETFIYLPPIPASSAAIVLPEAAAIRTLLFGHNLYINHLNFPGTSGVSVLDTKTNAIVGFMDTDKDVYGNDGAGMDPDYNVIVGHTLYIPNEDYNTVAVYNADTYAFIKTITSTAITDTNDSASGATLVGSDIYINNTDDCGGVCYYGTNPVNGVATGTVSVLNTNTNSIVATIPVGLEPSYSTPVGTNLYVSNGTSTVSVIDTKTNTVTATIPVGLEPLYSTPVGTNLYVPNRSSNTVSVIDTLTNTVTATIPVGNQPTAGILVGTNLYVTSENTVSVIDTKTNTVTATITVLGGLSQISFPAVLVGANLYIPDEGGTVSVIDTKTNTVMATLAVGTNPSALNLVGTNLYVTNFYSPYGAPFTTSSLSIIDTLTNRIMDVNAPILDSFTSAFTNGTYTTGQSVNITANFSESIAATSTMTVTLNTGATVALNTVSGDTLSGTYVVGAGDTPVPDLNVASIVNAVIPNASDTDVGISYSVPAHLSVPGGDNGNIGDTSNISIAQSYFTIPVGTNPAGIAAAGNVLYVANEGSSTVSAVNASTSVLLATIHVGTNPYGVAYDAATQEIYVSNEGTSTVSVIDANPSDGTYNTVTYTISVGSNPQGVAASGTSIYVANNISNTVSVINAATHTVSSTVSVGDAPTGIAILGTNVYVANSNIQPYFNVSGQGGTVSVIDANPSDGTYDTVMNTIFVGADPQGVAASGTSVYVTNASGGTVSVIDANPSDGTYDTVTNTISVGNVPSSALVSGSNLYVNNTSDGTISAINTGSDTVAATVPAGNTPTGMAAVGNTLYLASFTDGALSSFNTMNNTMNEVATSSPSIALTAPAAGAIVSGVISVSASSSAVSPASLTSVQFSLDSTSTILGTATSSPYTILWNTSTTIDGEHTLYAIATDNYGNTSTTSENITVADSSIPPAVVVPAVTPPSAPSTSGPTVSVAAGGGGYYTPVTTGNTSSGVATSTTISTSGMTIAQLQTLLASLMAQLQTLEAQAGTGNGSSSLSSFVFTRNLQFGMSGNDANALQSYLVQEDIGPAAQKLKTHGVTHYFGLLTQSALIEFQKANNITPAVGYFGPITRGRVEGR